MESRRPLRARDALGRPIPVDDPRAVEPVSEEPQPPGPTLDQAQELLDAGRAFSAHEVLEARWKSCPPGERELWQGLAQLCVGITHAQRGNQVGAQRLLRRGAGRLARYVGPAYGLDPGQLSVWAERAAAAPDHAQLQLRPGRTAK